MTWENNILGEIRRMRRKMNSLFGNYQDSPFDSGEMDRELDEDYRRAWTEFKENEDEFILDVELPGIDKKDIILNAVDNRLEIRARKKQEMKEKNEEKGIYRYSKSYAGFMKSVTLPESADIENIDADFENGILRIRIPRKKSMKIKKKEIKVK